MPSLTLNRRICAAVAALALIGSLAFAAGAQAEEADPTVVEPTLSEVVEPAPAELEPADLGATDPAPAELEPADLEATEPEPEAEPEPTLSFARLAPAQQIAAAPVTMVTCPANPTTTTSTGSNPGGWSLKPGVTGAKYVAGGLSLDATVGSGSSWAILTLPAGTHLSQLGDLTTTLASSSGQYWGGLIFEGGDLTDQLHYDANGRFWTQQAGIFPAVRAGYYQSFDIVGGADQVGTFTASSDPLIATIKIYVNEGQKAVVSAQAFLCGVQLYAADPAPTNLGCPTARTAVTIDAASDLVYDNKSGGSSSVTSKGLELSWHGVGVDYSNSKVAWYYPTSFPLSQLGTPSIGYTVTTGASAGQNFTVTVDGVWKGNIVKEPGIDDYWTTFTIPGFVNPANTPSYRKAVGTIDQFLAAYWADSQAHVITVVAVGGSGGSGSEGTGILKTQSAGCFDLTFGVPAPVVASCLPANLVNVAVTTPSQLVYDSRTGGSSSVTSKGLQVAWHGPDLSQSKVAWYYPTNFPLSQLGTPSIDYDVTSGASVGQNFTVTVDGVWKGNIVKEPGIADYWTTFSIPGMSADPTASYRKAIGTIQDFVNAYWVDNQAHDVRVVAIGGSGGSGSEGVGVVHSQTAGCIELTYGVPAPVVETCLPANLVRVAVTTASQLTYDSRTGGSSSVTSKGLDVAWHGPDLSQSKVAWYYATDFPLYKLGTPSISYDVTSGASVGQNFTVTVDGVWKGNIVKEPGIADYWTTFSIPGMSADPTASYRKAIGTIQDFVNAYWVDNQAHDVRVVAIGGSGGSGSEGVGVVKTQTAGCYELTYGVPAVIVTPPVTTPPATTPPATTPPAAGTTTVTPGPVAAAATTPTPTPTATATPKPTPSATPAPADDATDELPTEAFGGEPTGDAAPWWPWAVGGAILLLLLLLWFLLFRRRRANES